MVADLLYRDRLQRISRSEVEKLLGPPTSESGSTFFYNVGPAFGDSETNLEIEFQSDGTVKTAQVIGHG